MHVMSKQQCVPAILRLVYFSVPLNLAFSQSGVVVRRSVVVGKNSVDVVARSSYLRVRVICLRAELKDIEVLVVSTFLREFNKLKQQLVRRIFELGRTRCHFAVISRFLHEQRRSIVAALISSSCSDPALSNSSNRIKRRKPGGSNIVTLKPEKEIKKKVFAQRLFT